MACLVLRNSLLQGKLDALATRRAERAEETLRMKFFNNAPLAGMSENHEYV
jgi:hypothetical protein